jgi:uncharacterized protein involved in response to NO
LSSRQHLPEDARGRPSAARRRAASLPILENAFRPFFLGGASWAVIALAVWLAVLAGQIVVPTAFAPLAWHQHEMLFGYASAIIAGFALTAVPNWTGRLPLRGGALAGLFGLWLVGRIAVQVSLWTGPAVVLVLDVGFLTVLAGVVLREVAAGRNWRNLPVGALLTILALANLLTHLEPALALATGDVGIRLGLAAVLVLIGLIGGRVTPSFTRNWLVKQGAGPLPASFDRFDQLAVLALALSLLAWVPAPDGAVTGSLLVIAGVLHALRLARWHGARTRREPLVTILHLGYGWLALGLVLLGFEVHGLLPVPFAALHALTAGAIGTMTLAVMTRASLGHTGHALHAGPLTVTIYTTVIAGALLRVVAPALPGPATFLSFGSLLWGGAFLLFVLGYGPMLIRRRAEQGS